jgi:hypothetical protein
LKPVFSCLHPPLQLANKPFILLPEMAKDLQDSAATLYDYLQEELRSRHRLKEEIMADNAPMDETFQVDDALRTAVLNHLKNDGLILTPKNIVEYYFNRQWDLSNFWWKPHADDVPSTKSILVFEFENYDAGELRAEFDYRGAEYPKNHFIKVFDVDGTILETQNCVGNSAREMFKSHTEASCKVDPDGKPTSCWVEYSHSQHGDIFYCEHGRYNHSTERNLGFPNDDFFGKVCLQDFGWEF